MEIRILEARLRAQQPDDLSHTVYEVEALIVGLGIFSVLVTRPNDATVALEDSLPADLETWVLEALEEAGIVRVKTGNEIYREEIGA